MNDQVKLSKVSSSLPNPPLPELATLLLDDINVPWGSSVARTVLIENNTEGSLQHLKGQLLAAAIDPHIKLLKTQNDMEVSKNSVVATVDDAQAPIVDLPIEELVQDDIFWDFDAAPAHTPCSLSSDQVRQQIVVNASKTGVYMYPNPPEWWSGGRTSVKYFLLWQKSPRWSTGFLSYSRSDSLQ